jgi:hypothetical protein
MNAEIEYKTAIAELDAAQRNLGSTPRTDSQAREAATRVVEAAMARVRETKEAVKTATTRRNFAGLQTPLFEAIVDRLDPSVVAELESDAIRRQAERDARGAARRAAKAAAAPPVPPVPPPKPATRERKGAVEPEIIVRRPRASGGVP